MVCAVSFLPLCSDSLLAEGASAIRAQINGPSALAIDNRGHLFLVEMNENKVLKVDLREGTISTVAGNGRSCCYREGAKATEVSLGFLRVLAADSRGNLFIGEHGQVKRIDAVTGLISTVADDETFGDTVEGISARSAHF